MVKTLQSQETPSSANPVSADPVNCEEGFKEEIQLLQQHTFKPSEDVLEYALKAIASLEKKNPVA